jgi:hypothetical protein
MKSTFIGLLLLMSPAISFADASSTDGTGNQLMVFCNDTNKETNQTAWFGCMMFIDGVVNGSYTVGVYQYIAQYGNKVNAPGFDPSTFVAQTFNVCIPDGTTREQRALVASKYLKDNPQSLHEPSAMLVIAALNSAWPCPSKK